jgi:hypothetical protein
VIHRNRRPRVESGHGVAGDWQGATRDDDLLKEFVVALLAVTVLVAGLAAALSSPDEKAITLQRWASADPGDFVTTATGELAGTTTSAGYGPPYNTASHGTSIGPLMLQRWAGVRIPVDSAQDFVISPLSREQDPAVQAAVARWTAAPSARRVSWASGYAQALQDASADPARVRAGDYGPVPELTSSLLGLARSGGLDSALVDPGTGFYQTDYTRPLLFLADGSYVSDQAAQNHLTGDQWGMMNETGNYPGQPWLWLYTFWYQVPPFTTAWSANADALIWGVMMLLSLALLLLPFIPGLRSLPRRLGIYRLIWRDYYRGTVEEGRGDQRMP